MERRGDQPRRTRSNTHGAKFREKEVVDGVGVSISRIGNLATSRKTCNSIGRYRLCSRDPEEIRFAEQLRAASLSISNNIAEGSGSNSDKDFIKFLFIARKSAFECASMLMIFQQQSYLNTEPNGLIAELEAVSRMIVSFARSLEK